MNKLIRIIVVALPVAGMVALIPFVADDYVLTAIYLGAIALLFSIKRGRNDLLIFAVGFFVMLISEAAFVATGVEQFTRHTLFGIMPIWLPVLWAYAFVAISRGLRILESHAP